MKRGYEDQHGHPLEVLGISGICLLRSQASRRLAHCATEDFEDIHQLHC